MLKKARALRSGKPTVRSLVAFMGLNMLLPCDLNSVIKGETLGSREKGHST
jgi:hypothetical protein